MPLTLTEIPQHWYLLHESANGDDIYVACDVTVQPRFVGVGYRSKPIARIESGEIFTVTSKWDENHRRTYTATLQGDAPAWMIDVIESDTDWLIDLAREEEAA